MGLVRTGTIARRLDVLSTTAKELPFAMLHFTGPADFNVALRKIAMQRGMRLSERGWDCEDAAEPASEEDVLRELGVKYLEPEYRSGNIVRL